MGVVYRARQTSLGRIVALKLLLAGQFASKHLIQRFRGEVTAAALLQHPNIVAIHEVGIHDGQHYFSMDYVDGKNLSQLVASSPLPSAKAAHYVKLVAEAIHYAHQQGILHRDLKPSNVLVDASDQPRITDFGLAKRLDGDLSITMTGQMLGSPNFMPPEQATTQNGKVGRHSDVYGLGAILYHLVTARPPFQGESFESVINQLLNADPASPSLLNPTVPPDLETICVKCLQKEPLRRYQSAQELADELDRFLRHEPIQARPITGAERTWRWCWRNPVVSSLSGATVLLLLAVAIGSPITAFRINRERQRAVAAEREQVKLRDEAETALSAFRPDGAEMLLHSSDAAAALSTLALAVRRFPEHPRLWKTKGLLLEQNGKIEEAVRDFTQAIRLAEAHTDTAVELSEALLHRSRLLKRLGRLAEAGADYCRAKNIPVRDSQAPPTLIDLSLYYDAPLTESIHNDKGHPGNGNDLAGVPLGRAHFAGVEFDVRGIIPLNGTELIYVTLPEAVTNIPINLTFSQIHCFMGTGWREHEGAQIGTFILHYAGGQKEELPIRYAIHVRDCIAQPMPGEFDDNPLDRAVVAWTGLNLNAQRHSGHLRLYKSTWDNPRPDLEVRSLDFVSSMTHCAPFLIAMTVE
jgi:tetratricopeptide (TPR) repeat protein